MQPIDLVNELREKMGLPVYTTRSDAAKQVWDETMVEVNERLAKVEDPPQRGKTN